MLLERLTASGPAEAEPPPVGDVVPGPEGVLEVALPPVVTSPAEARRELACLCRSRDVPRDLAACGALVGSELVTNVVLHARTPAVP